MPCEPEDPDALTHPSSEPHCLFPHPGVVRLMDMLTEREIIRNEALLLLVALTRANEEVQKIAAFEGAFDR